MSLQECTDHNADAVCWKCALPDEAPRWWLKLRGGIQPIRARPRRRSPFHRNNADDRWIEYALRRGA